MEFLYTNIDDVKDAWMQMLGQFVSEQPGVEMSWEMRPCGENAIVTIQIAKPGDLEVFTESEAKGALGAVDALFDEKEEKPKKKASKSEPKPKSKAKKSSKPETKTKSQPKEKKKAATPKKK